MVSSTFNVLPNFDLLLSPKSFTEYDENYDIIYLLKFCVGGGMRASGHIHIYDSISILGFCFAVCSHEEGSNSL
jgi:hypothetical protein